MLHMMPLKDTDYDLSTAVVQPEEYSITYIPPLYTNPRPIIPRYRIISGFLSMLIMGILLCTGADYYAKVSGQLDYLSRAYGSRPPNLLPAPTPPLPDPQGKVDHGPAYLIIPSASMTTHLDTKDPFFVPNPETIFKSDQIFYLIYSVHPPAQGTVTIKWYTDNMLYYSSPKVTIPSGHDVTGKASMQYAKAAEGKVELYWNDQLALTLYFVVRG
jgi:hypothetical protein